MDCRFVELVTVEGRCGEAKTVRSGGARLSDAEVVRVGLTVFTDESIHPSIRTQRVLKLFTEQRTTAAIIEGLKQSRVSVENQSTKVSCSSADLAKDKCGSLLRSLRRPGDPAAHLTYGEAKKELEQPL